MHRHCWLASAVDATSRPSSTTRWSTSPNHPQRAYPGKQQASAACSVPTPSSTAPGRHCGHTWPNSPGCVPMKRSSPSSLPQRVMLASLVVATAGHSAMHQQAARSKVSLISTSPSLKSANTSRPILTLKPSKKSMPTRSSARGHTPSLAGYGIISSPQFGVARAVKPSELLYGKKGPPLTCAELRTR